MILFTLGCDHPSCTARTEGRYFTHSQTGQTAVRAIDPTWTTRVFVPGRLRPEVNTRLDEQHFCPEHKP